jgi:ABC-type cobalamin/Fe3+-siderophores transport system ATPase subunit
MELRMEMRNATCGYDGKPVVKKATFSVSEGEVLCLLGPNGSGKTTLFKTILGLLKLQNGEILLDGADTCTWPRRKIAQVIGYVPQAHAPTFPFDVIDMVLMGRTAHLGTFATPSEEDKRIALEAIEKLGISYLKDRVYTEISGGERQLVLIARALAQQPRILVMDEPTTSLDFGNQMLVLKHIEYLSNLNIGVVMSSHFPNHAFSCASKVMLLNKGVVFGLGSPEETVTEENLKKLYGVDVKIITASIGNGQQARVCIPVTKRAAMESFTDAKSAACYG